ncbi:hypothetical protein scyTo_0013767 [Scyliorhinus torazame]|uniref:Uncharacterized protein n=1 Tax=Scyliorhinus torazame TaxID=75743 RepID=A0A401P4K0_SCYTO|nr:hypothetical protein [Scyliorhinus torazame]
MLTTPHKNTPIAILTQDNPLTCIYPCINLTHQEIWLNCTLINDTLIKYTCTKHKKVYEFTHNFKDKGKYQFGFILLAILNPKVLNNGSLGRVVPWRYTKVVTFHSKPDNSFSRNVRRFRNKTQQNKKTLYEGVVFYYQMLYNISGLFK